MLQRNRALPYFTTQLRPYLNVTTQLRPYLILQRNRAPILCYSATALLPFQLLSHVAVKFSKIGIYSRQQFLQQGKPL